MKYLKEDEKYKHYVDYYQGYPVRFMVNKKTNDVSVCFDDMARVGGYKSVGEMIAANQDLLNEFLEEFKEGNITTDDDDDA